VGRERGQARRVAMGADRVEQANHDEGAAHQAVQRRALSRGGGQRHHAKANGKTSMSQGTSYCPRCPPVPAVGQREGLLVAGPPTFAGATSLAS
jgi:hypothetical protein